MEDPKAAPVPEKIWEQKTGTQQGAAPGAASGSSAKPADPAVPAGAAPKRPGERAEIQKAIQVFRRETGDRGFRADQKKSSRQRASGLSLLHGRVYGYLRNNAFDAVPHEIVQRGGDQNLLRRNQIGFSASGPVQIPKLYDGRRSTFFTFSYEGTQESVGRSYLKTLPTALQRSGDFSDLVDVAGNPMAIYDPSTTRLNPLYDATQPVTDGNLQHIRDPFPNNQTPVTRLDSVAAASLPYYPLPNTDVGPFLQNNYWANPIEENSPAGFLAKLDHNLFERHKITLDLAYSRGLRGEPEIYPTIATPSRPDRRFTDRRIGVSDTFAISPQTIYNASLEASSQSVGTEGLDSGQSIPDQLGLRGVSGDVFPQMLMVGLSGLGTPMGAQFRNVWNTYSTDHSLSLQRGAHSWTFSTSMRFYQLNTLELETPSGSFEFNHEQTGLPGIVNTGSPFASFLLGRPFRALTSEVRQPSYLRQTSWQTQVRDEYELTPNLTATLSVNVDTSTPRVEKFDRQSTVDPAAINPANELPGALVFADASQRSFQPVRVRLEPRVGISWSPTDKRDTVIRASITQYYSPIPLQTGTFATQGFSVRRTFVSPNFQLDPALLLHEGVPAMDVALPNLSPAAANDSDADLIARTARQPMYRYAALDLERQLPRRLTVRIGTQFQSGADLLVGSTVAGLNQIPVGALRFRDQLNDELFRRSLRPFPHFQRLETDSQFPMGRFRSTSTYFQVEKQASEGLTLDFSYWIRNQSDDYSGPGVQDYFDRESAWSLSRGVRPHHISLSYIYELPFGKGKPLLSTRRWAHQLLGNWSVSGFTSWSNGDPIVLTPIFNNTGGIVPFLRVNTVPGVEASVSDPGPHMWFNPDAFVGPADFALGDVARTHPTLRNPGYHNHDLSVTKRVPISSEQSLELLFQGFNFVNHANWANPDTMIGPEGVPNANSGRILESRGGRVIQLGVRYNF